jgi:protease I
MAKIAVVLAPDFEDSELEKPKDALQKAGHELVVIGNKVGDELEGKQGEAFATVEATADSVRAEDFDALLIPGGYSPDKLRLVPSVVSLVRRFFELGRPVAAVCHGPQLLIEAGVVKGRTLTSWPSVKTDLVNAGATWVDREVVTDGNLVTSRKPGDLDAFSRAFAKLLEDAGRKGLRSQSERRA